MPYHQDDTCSLKGQRRPTESCCNGSLSAGSYGLLYCTVCKYIKQCWSQVLEQVTLCS